MLDTVAVVVILADDDRLGPPSILHIERIVEAEPVRDLAVRRRKTEVGALLGATVAKARSLGVAMPLTERLIAMIEDLELGRRVMSWSNIDELVAAGRRGA